MRVAFAVILVVPVIRILEMGVTETNVLMFRSFETSCDALAAGCLLAGIRDFLGTQRWYLRFTSSPAPLILPIAILLGSMSFIHPRFQVLIGAPFENICIALLIDYVVRQPEATVGRFLNVTPLVYVGVLSYSLYLWQELFCTQFRFPNVWWRSFPFSIALAFGAALTSYYLIEQPFLKVRNRFRSSPHSAAGLLVPQARWAEDVEDRT